MPEGNGPREMFKCGVKLFRNKKYADAKEIFYGMGDTDETLSSNCSVLSALYYVLSSAAASGNSKNLRDIQDIVYDDTEFNALQTVFLRQFMTDFKNIMESVFDYKNHEGIYEDILSWYNGIIGERLKNDKEILAL